MISVKVKKTIDKTMITHKIERDEQISNLEIEVVGRGDIAGLIAPSLGSTFTGKKTLNFVVADHVPLVDHLRCGITFREFAELLENIIKIIKGCRDQSIRVSNLETRPEYIYYNFNERCITMLYWPLIKMNEYADEQNLFLKLTEMYFTSNEEDARFRDYFDMYLKERKKFDFYNCSKTLSTLKKKWLEQTNEQISEDEELEFEEIPKDIFDQTISLISPTLFYVTKAKKIEITKSDFLIGRHMSCDLVVEGDSTVSKEHVKLIRRGNSTQIVDLGSTNGVFVNGEKIPPMTEMDLPNDSSIMIGSQEFIFEVARMNK